MALSAARLATAIKTAFISIYNQEDDDHQDDPYYFFDSWANGLATAIINEITVNARCNGNDSGGDSHNNVGII